MAPFAGDWPEGCRSPPTSCDWLRPHLRPDKSPRGAPPLRGPGRGRAVRKVAVPHRWLRDPLHGSCPHRHRSGHTTKAATAPPNPPLAPLWPHKARLPHDHCRARPVQALQVPQRCHGAAPRYRDEPHRGHRGTGDVGTRLLWLWRLDLTKAGTQPRACRATGLVGNTQHLKNHGRIK